MASTSSSNPTSPLVQQSSNRNDRTPFVPIRKHKPSNSPPPSPLLSPPPATTRLTRTMVQPPSTSIGGTAGGATAGPVRVLPTPLGSSNIHNLPTSPPLSKVTYASPALTSSDSFTSPPLSSAPRIRAKITPAAQPRRKALPGTEYADIPTAALGPSSPIKRTPARQPPQPLSSPSVSTASFGAFPSMSAVPEDGEMGTLQGGMMGLGLGNPFSPPRLRSVTGSASDAGFARVRRGKGGRDNVLVCVRVRPPTAKLAASSKLIDEVAWDVDEASGKLVQYAGGPEYLFDSVVTGSRNEEVYVEAGRELVLDAMEGFDAVIFAYGQTASGKTFTLSGNHSNPGIIPQAVSDIFSFIRDHPEKEFLLRASYLEIYNETLKDLLDPTSGPVKVRQDEKKRFFVQPLREEVVTTEAQVAALLRRGNDNRHVGQTDFNERSSRSHSVFQMTIESRDDPTSTSSILSEASTPRRGMAQMTPNAPRLTPGADGVVRMSRLSLIDLAGSEQATSQIERRSEGAFINKSLLTLEKVIASLTSDAKQKPHVPYRDSKLTQILQPSLSGDARVAVIATMNPSPMAIEESKSTLKFAQRVKKVVLKAVMHEVVDDKALITKYRSHIAMLEAQLKSTLASAPGTPSQADFEADKSRQTKQAERVHDLERQVEEFRSLFLTSHNMEQRRKSALPPRPVSPMKVGRSDSPDDDDSTSVHDALAEAQDDLLTLRSERDSLLLRISTLEADHLSTLQSSDSEKDARIAELLRENQELRVVVMNVDVGEEGLKRMERKFERREERHKVYQEGLEASLALERKRGAQFERFILQHLTSQTQVLKSGRRSSVINGISSTGGGLAHSASVNGFVPLMAESPDLDAISPDFVELEELPFSSAARDTIRKSGRGGAGAGLFG
ncbi:hypothetical protein JCM11641_001234 [Rhodosporidiobolus odoratus]